MSGVEHGSFTLTRELKAPVEMVFKAWADPDAKARWFNPPVKVTNMVREQNFRVGGRDRFKATWPEGRTTDFQCEYRDIVENERIVYVYDMHIDARKISVSLATLLFEKTKSGTRLTVTEQGTFLNGYVDAGSRERGTNDLLDALVRSLGG